MGVEGLAASGHLHDLDDITVADRRRRYLARKKRALVVLHDDRFASETDLLEQIANRRHVC